MATARSRDMTMATPMGMGTISTTTGTIITIMGITTTVIPMRRSRATSSL